MPRPSLALVLRCQDCGHPTRLTIGPDQPAPRVTRCPACGSARWRLMLGQVVASRAPRAGVSP